MFKELVSICFHKGLDELIKSRTFFFHFVLSAWFYKIPHDSPSSDIPQKAYDSWLQFKVAENDGLKHILALEFF